MRFGIQLSSNLRMALEILAVALVAAIAGQQATGYLTKHYDKAQFYQSRFSLAVSLACGGGWNALRAATDEPLTKFLERRVSHIECAEVDLTRRAPIREFVDQHRYLMAAAGLWWKIQGRPDWNALAGLLCVLFVASAISAYAVLRLGAPVLLAGVGAALFAASEVHLSNLIHLRDYSKAPFLLAGAAATLLIVYRWGAGRPTLVAASCIGGLVAGLGVGFRQDLLLLVPFTVLSILVFGGGHLLADLRKKIALISIFLAVFAAIGAPVLTGLARGSNTSHVILLGLMSPFDRPLGVRSSYYEFGDRYNDGYAASLINASHAAGAEEARFIYAGTVDYEKAGMAYLRKLALIAPGDFATRAVAAAFSALSYDYRFPFLRDTAWANTLPLAALLLLLAYGLLVEIPLAMKVYAAFVVLYFSGTAFLQFSERHFFHLAIFQIVALTWGIDAVRKAIAMPLSFLGTQSVIEASKKAWQGSIARFARNALYLSLVVLVAYAALAGVRYLQAQRLAAFFERTGDPSAYTALSKAASEDGVKYAAEFRDSALQMGGRHFDFEYLMARFDASRCGSFHVDLVSRYEAIDDFNNFTRSYRLAIDNDTKFLLPVFRFHGSQFVHLEIPAEQANCVSFIGKLKNKRLDFLPIARLDQNWRQRPAYQMLAIEHHLRTKPDHREDYVERSGMRVSERMAWQRLNEMDALRTQELAYASPSVSQSASGVTVKRPAAKAEYLLLKQLAVSNPDCSLGVVAEGEIIRGGLTVGALSADRGSWDAAVHIVESGRFRALVVAKGKRAVPIIANNATGIGGSAATISKFGSVELCP